MQKSPPPQKKWHPRLYRNEDNQSNQLHNTYFTRHSYKFREPRRSFHLYILMTLQKRHIARCNSDKSSTRCNNFSSILLDVYLQINMFRASSRPSSRAQQLQ